MGVLSENARFLRSQRLNENFERYSGQRDFQQTPAPIPDEVLDEILAEFEDVPRSKSD